MADAVGSDGLGYVCADEGHRMVQYPVPSLSSSAQMTATQGDLVGHPGFNNPRPSTPTSPSRAGGGASLQQIKGALRDTLLSAEVQMVRTSLPLNPKP